MAVSRPLFVVVGGDDEGVCWRCFRGPWLDLLGLLTLPFRAMPARSGSTFRVSAVFVNSVGVQAQCRVNVASVSGVDKAEGCETCPLVIRSRQESIFASFITSAHGRLLSKV